MTEAVVAATAGMTFPDVIDNSFREAANICQMKARYAYVENLSPPFESVHLKFGGAHAEGAEHVRRAFYELGMPAAEAIEHGIAKAEEYWGDFEPPEKSNKTLESLRESLRYEFANAWPLEQDTYRPHRMEWRFKVPIPGLVHPDHGGPIYYGGRPDTLGDISEQMVIEDDKTASSLGASWSKQWELDSQFTGYQWAAQQLGLIKPGGVGGVLIRGISILAPKYDDVELGPDEFPPEGLEERTISSPAGRKVKRVYSRYNRLNSFGHAQVLVYRPQWMIERWLVQMTRDVKRLIHAYLNDEWDMALHKGACNAYGGCPYVPLCSTPNPEQWKEINFVKRVWDPLAHL